MTIAPEPLPLRAWRAARRRGLAYAWHKAMRRALSRWPALKRRWAYRDPRAYWALRGGEDYVREQEDHPTRGLRAEWFADQVAALAPRSVLEVGCGYGKQLALLRDRLPEARLVGLDFSPTQLAKAREWLAGKNVDEIVLASAESVPFADRSFDLVFSSAVVLHNPPEAASRVLREMARVARTWVAHNEDINVTYNRYGIDVAGLHRAAGRPLARVETIPLPDLVERAATQFCLAGPFSEAP